MRWIYILKCDGDVYYVGETTRLYKRFWQHANRNGGVNTEMYEPLAIVAIYPLYRMGRFFDYVQNVKQNTFSIYFNNYRFYDKFNVINDKKDELYDEKSVENNIAETMMMHNPSNWENIRGGKYVRFDCEYSFPRNDIVSDLPLCKCMLPCDVRRNEDNTYFYFRCAKKNIYSDLIENVDIHVDTEPCNYYLQYTNDVEYVRQYDAKKKQIYGLTNKSTWLKRLNEFTEYCLGGCGKTYDGDNTIRYNRKPINLCFGCFTNKYYELANKYDQNDKIGKLLSKHCDEMVECSTSDDE